MRVAVYLVTAMLRSLAREQYLRVAPCESVIDALDANSLYVQSDCNVRVAWVACLGRCQTDMSHGMVTSNTAMIIMNEAMYFHSPHYNTHLF